MGGRLRRQTCRSGCGCTRSLTLWRWGSRKLSPSAQAMLSWVSSASLCSPGDCPTQRQHGRHGLAQTASILRYFLMGLNPPGLCLKIMLIEETAPPSQLSLRQSSVLSGNGPRAAWYVGRKAQIHPASRQGCGKEVPAWTQTMLQESTRCLSPCGGGSILPAQQVLLAHIQVQAWRRLQSGMSSSAWLSAICKLPCNTNRYLSGSHPLLADQGKQPTHAYASISPASCALICTCRFGSQH